MKLSTFIAVFLSVTFLYGIALGNDVIVKSKNGIGRYLADSEGMTLYYFKNDSPGKSTCKGECIQKWPLFSVDEIEAEKGLNEEEFGIIIRDDGSEQTTFRGYALYYFIGDKKEGDTNGHGIKDLWFVINPERFMK